MLCITSSFVLRDRLLMVSLFSMTVKRHGWPFMPEGAQDPADNILLMTSFGTALSLIAAYASPSCYARI